MIYSFMLSFIYFLLQQWQLFAKPTNQIKLIRLVDLKATWSLLQLLKLCHCSTKAARDNI